MVQHLPNANKIIFGFAGTGIAIFSLDFFLIVLEPRSAVGFTGGVLCAGEVGWRLNTKLNRVNAWLL